MKEMKITDIKGIQVGSCEDKKAGTGCSVIIAKEGATAGVDVRGGAPATRETDLLNPRNSVSKIHAVMLSGGSAFGLDACHGAMEYFEQAGIGFDMGVAKIPIVCGASLFDLNVGDPQVRPNKYMGFMACLRSESNEIKEGNYGAGCGASVGKILGSQYAMKGGLGTYALDEDGIQVGAVVAVNACGNVVDYQSRKMIAGAFDKEKNKFIDLDTALKQIRQTPGANTTIGCIVTNVKLNKAQCTKIASIAHNGYALTISPTHTMSDGDTIFVMSTGEIEAEMDIVGILATKVMAIAINNAVKKAKSAYGLLAYEDIKDTIA